MAGNVAPLASYDDPNYTLIGVVINRGDKMRSGTILLIFGLLSIVLLAAACGSGDVPPETRQGTATMSSLASKTAQAATSTRNPRQITTHQVQEAATAAEASQEEPNLSTRAAGNDMATLAVATVEETYSPTRLSSAGAGTSATGTKIPSPAPTSSWQTASVAELKEEMYLIGGYGGGMDVGCDEFAPEPGTQLPILVNAGVRLGSKAVFRICVFGVFTDESLVVTLYEPDGRRAGGQDIFPDQNVLATDAYSGVPAATFFLWLPAGAPRGTWRVTLSGDQIDHEQDIAVQPRDRATIDTRPSLNVDPFDLSQSNRDPAHHYEGRDCVYIAGEGLESQQRVPLGIYRVGNMDSATQETPIYLVAGQYASTDSQGAFETSFDVPPDFPAGSYIVVAVTDPSTDRIGQISSTIDSFFVAGETGAERCVNDAEFVADVTVPDYTHMSPGEIFTKTWRLRNNGTCPWTEDYRFAHFEDDRLGAPAFISLEEEVAPGEVVDLSVRFTAPEQEEKDYVSRWRMQAPNGTFFGRKPYLLITVSGNS